MGVLLSQRSELLSRHQILSLYLPSMVLALGSSMVAPVIPVYAKSFDVALSTAALVFVAYNMGALAATFPAGYLIDRIGRRPVLLSGPLLEALAALMTPFAGSFTLLLFWRFLSGAANQTWQQSRLAVIADTAHERERARQVQWMLGVARAGQLLGPAVGGLLSAAFGIAVPFLLHAGLMVLIVLPSFWIIQESAPDRQRSSTGATTPTPAGAGGWRPVLAYLFTFQMLTFLVIQFMATMCRGGQEHGSLNLYAVYAYGLGPAELGLLSTAAVAFGLPVPFLIGYLMDRFGRRAIITPGFTLYALALILMAFTGFLSSPVMVFLVSYVLVQATMGTTGGTMQVLGTDLAPRFARGRFFAIWRGIAQLGSALSPGVFALIADRVSPGVGFVYLAGCAMVVAIGVGAVLGNTLKQVEAREAEVKREAEGEREATEGS